MKYPKLTEMNTSREWLEVFKGYNHNLRIGEGEFYDMKNLSSDNFPVLSPRQRRGVYAYPTEPQGMVAKDALCYVDGRFFCINEHRIDMGLTVEYDEEDGKVKLKNLISMGAYVIIMPDKKYINTVNHSDRGSIEAYKTTSSPVTFELCTIDGAQYGKTVSGTTEPVITDEMKEGEEDIPLWLDTSASPHTLKMYSTTHSTWTAIATTYIKISSTGIGLPFSVGDGVTITGVEGIPDLASPTSAVIWAKDDRVGDNNEKISDWIVVKGILEVEGDEPKTQNTPICVSRWMPDFDYVIESGNRLWGCKYGLVYMGKAYDAVEKKTVDVYSEDAVNTIYVCKLGDFKNWNCYQSISTDSYYVSVGTDGQFTGAITHLDHPIFFKENCMHKVYGNYPANFQVQTTACRGVQKGCERSLAIVNEVLYYKARSGVCSYDGSLPVEISSALGEVSYSKAVAGAIGNKYYISMQDVGGKYNLFVYDSAKGMWHREDEMEVMEFCNCRGDLYFIDRHKKQIQTVRGSGDLKEASQISWMAVTGIIGTDSPDKKYVSRMDVRMSVEVDTSVIFFIEYDSSGEWEYLFTMTGEKLGSFAVPIRPKRCDHMRLKILGVGDAKIFSICKTMEWGSDV